LCKRVVVKFGGADLSSAEKIQKAAQMIVRAPYKEIIVVVSAMGEMTDNLDQLISSLNQISDADYAEIISMGERISARVFSTALKSLGVESEFVDPSNPNWPIITNSQYKSAVPDLENSSKLASKYLVPMLGKKIPVICGFIGKNLQGKITTLGRGGSDTTALLLARFVSADEVLLVKQTNGVLSADPKYVPGAQPIKKIGIQEMFDLAQGGAKIIKPESLKYKLPNQILRIVDFSDGDLRGKGTEITGCFYPNSAEIKSYKNLTALNVICEVNSENLSEIFQILRSKLVYGVSSGSKSITVFISDIDIKLVLNELNQLPNVKAISHKENVSLIQITHPMFIDSPGGVAQISNALSKNSINILEITTSKATINVFIREKQLKNAKDAIRNAV
jgi:aspartate kinase